MNIISKLTNLGITYLFFPMISIILNFLYMIFLKKITKKILFQTETFRPEKKEIAIFLLRVFGVISSMLSNVLSIYIIAIMIN